MTTKEQAYAIVLDEVTNILKAINTTVAQWADAPKMRLSLVGMPLSKALKKAITNLGELNPDDEGAQVRLNDFIEKFAGYEATVSSSHQVINNGQQLVSTFKTILLGLLKELGKEVPAAEQMRRRLA